MRPTDVEDIYELSPLQQGMLFHTLSMPDSGVFFEQQTFSLQGAVNGAAFRNAWQRVMARHPVLRTSFHWDDLEKPLQVVHRNVTIPFERKDWRLFPRSELRARLDEFLAADRARGFDITHAPLMRFTLIETEGGRHEFIWSFHHILLDGWSGQLVLNEVAAFYQAACLDESLQLATVPPYRDYIVWLQGQDLSRAEEFWRGYLNGFCGPTQFAPEMRPTDARGPTGGAFSEHELVVSNATNGALRSLARLHRLTLNTIIQGAWAILLSRYSSETDVIFGAVVSGRPASLPSVESMVGLFINTLPVRANLKIDQPLTVLLSDLQSHQSEARQFEYSPMMQVQRWAALLPGESLFDSIVIFENFPAAAAKGGGDAATIRHLGRTNYPLNLLVVPGAELRIKLEYVCDRFDASSIRRMAGHLETLLGEIASNPDRTLSQIPMLTPQERRQIVFDWNDTQKVIPSDQSLVNLWNGAAQQFSDRVAFISDGADLTYAQLDRHANSLAHLLRSLGAGPEVVIGVCLERSLEAAIALIAVLKSGGAYLPLDPASPQARLAFMVEDANAKIVITQNPQLFGSTAATVVDLSDRLTLVHESDSAPDTQSLPNHLAYIIYTSGTTGRPKGVAVEHLQIINRLAWMWEAYPFQSGEVSCQKTSLGFVDSLWELLGPLLKSVPTVIIPDAIITDPHALVDELSKYRVTRLWLVPTLLQVILESVQDLQYRLPDLRFWVTSGEAISHELYERFREAMPDASLYNLYGTSEVWDVTWHDPQKESVEARTPPLGRPISNVRAFILDAGIEPVPVGAKGGLYVGGVGLARGYINLPELTAERFIPDPLSRTPGARLYKTYDLARYLPDGNIEFLGRGDAQVKIRGHRVEPQEIEFALIEHPAVKQVAVVTPVDARGESLLVAYIVPQEETNLSAAECRRYLETRLPSYMLPSAFFAVDELPVTTSGKLDRRSLPIDRAAIHSAKGAGPKNGSAPRNELERSIAAAWKEVMGTECDSVDDNFLEMGAHSLTIIRLHGKVRRFAPGEVSITDFFKYPNITALAAYLSSNQRESLSIETVRKRAESQRQALSRHNQSRELR